MFALIASPAKYPRDEIEYQAQDHTEKQAGYEGKREAEVISSNRNVARELAEPSQKIPNSRNAVCDQDQQPNQRHAYPDSDEDLAKISPFSHYP
jgi:hypothetical protein